MPEQPKFVILTMFQEIFGPFDSEEAANAYLARWEWDYEEPPKVVKYQDAFSEYQTYAPVYL